MAKAVKLEREQVGDRVVHSGRVGDVELRATITTMGTTAAAEATEFVLDNLDVDHVVVIGIAGGLGPDVQIGDLLVPEVVISYDTGVETHPTPLGAHTAKGKLLTSGALIIDRAVLLALADDGAAAIDMETVAVGEVCEARGVPWSAFRGISDHIRDGLVDGAVGGLAKPDGSADFGKLLRYLAPKPWRMRQLAKLGRDMNVAASGAANALVRSL
ncbi:MAG: adenosylhomocysteine nucleosidase [Acidimicrobiaceae bacterium]